MINTFNDMRYLELEASRLGGVPYQLLSDRSEICGIIKRPIPQTNLYDAVSAYGYPDMLANTVGMIDMNAFLDRVSSDAAAQSIVSAYFRVGLQERIAEPPQGDRFQKTHVGNVVHVPLDNEWDVVQAGFRKQLRNELRKPVGISISRSDDVAAFHKIYTQNMLRVGAKEEYFFSKEYFEVLCGLPGTRLIMAYDRTGPVAGAITLAHGNLLYYHLGATADRALSASPMKFVLAYIIRKNTARHTFRSLVLGGGLGGGEDALLRFKRGFSKAIMPVYSLKVIFDLGEYRNLLDAENMPLFEGFFPAYRSSSLSGD